jgi:DNA-binding transcriptional regulator GbsR (MarR family)
MVVSGSGDYASQYVGCSMLSAAPFDERGTSFLIARTRLMPVACLILDTIHEPVSRRTEFLPRNSHGSVSSPSNAEAEQIRRDFARAWGAIGDAWGVTPSTATVQGYMLLHGGPLTEADLREALGLSHRAALMALKDCEDWGLIEPADPTRSGQRGPAARAWVPVGEHWEWFRRVAGARKERETDPVLPLLEECEKRAAKLDQPQLRDRLRSLVQFVHEFDKGVDAIVRADPHALERLFAVLGRLDQKTLDTLLATIVAIPEDELVKAASTVAGMSPTMVRAFVAMANAPGLSRLLGVRGAT